MGLTSIQAEFKGELCGILHKQESNPILSSISIITNILLLNGHFDKNLSDTDSNSYNPNRNHFLEPDVVHYRMRTSVSTHGHTMCLTGWYISVTLNFWTVCQIFNEIFPLLFYQMSIDLSFLCLDRNSGQISCLKNHTQSCQPSIIFAETSVISAIFSRCHFSLNSVQIVGKMVQTIILVFPRLATLSYLIFSCHGCQVILETAVFPEGYLSGTTCVG